MSNDTKHRILKAASTLFANKGYEGVRTKEIAIAANTSEVTLFKYFPQKIILYKTLLSEFFQILAINEVIAQMSYIDLEHDLNLVAQATAQNMIANQEIILMRQKEKANFLSNQKFAIAKDPTYLAILPVFQKYYEQKQIKVLPTVAANIFITSLVGSFNLLVNNNFDEASYYQYLTNFVKIFVKGIE